MGLLDTAVSGLRISQASLRTTGHNIANANTEGFSRQRVESATTIPNLAASGYIGTGAEVTAVNRVVNEFVIEQLRIDTSLNGQMTAFDENVRQLNILLSDQSTSLSQSMNSFFSTLQSASDDPTSIPARQLVITESESLSLRFHTIYERLQLLNDGVDDGLEAAVTQINSLSSIIAGLNQRIADAAGGNDIQPNDFLDQRDEALRELSALVSIQTFDQGDGQINVLIGSGQSLVIGDQARGLDVVDSIGNAEVKEIAYLDGQFSQVITPFISGGELNGLLSFRDTVLSESFNELGRLALVIAEDINQTHSEGIDINNQFGGLFFNDVNDPTAALSRVKASSANAQPPESVLAVTIEDPSQITASDYQVSIADNNLLTITRLNDSSEVYRQSAPNIIPSSIEFDGLSFTILDGQFNPGEEFLIQPTRNAARDIETVIFRPDELAFASPVSTEASLGNTGSGRISAGQLIDLDGTASELGGPAAADGSNLPLFSSMDGITPPLLVRFNSPSSYDVLDNSNPGSPTVLLRNQQYAPGGANPIFSEDSSETLVSGLEQDISARLPITIGDPFDNGFLGESVSIRTLNPEEGTSTSQFVSLAPNSSAREIAASFTEIPGVQANAGNYLEINDIPGLVLDTDTQILLNGENLLPNDPSGINTTLPELYNYLAERINENSNLQDLGIYALSATDSTTGTRELRVYSTLGDDLTLSFTGTGATAGGLQVGNQTSNLAAPIAVGEEVSLQGFVDVTLAENMELSTTGVTSIFGDSTVDGFAKSTYFGIQASLDGVMESGDSFTIDFNENGVSDNRNALRMIELSLENSVENNTKTYGESYGTLVEVVGISASSSNINLEASEQILQQTTDLRSSISGVNLDEEASNLVLFEQLYGANAQVISVARELFDTLLNAV